MTLLLLALEVFLITALLVDALYTTIAWLIGLPSHPYQRPHHWRRYLWIVSIIAGEVAAITILTVVLVWTVQPPGLAL